MTRSATSVGSFSALDPVLRATIRTLGVRSGNDDAGSILTSNRTWPVANTGTDRSARRETRYRFIAAPFVVSHFAAPAQQFDVSADIRYARYRRVASHNACRRF